MTLLLGLAIAWLYAETVAGLGREWFSSADSSYGVVLFAVAAVVAWQRRERLVAAFDPASRHFSGLLLLTSGLVLFLCGEFGAVVFLTRVSLVVVIAGAVWFLGGAGVVRTMQAPLAFLLIAVPLPTLVVNAVTLPLQFTASSIAEGALNTAGIAVFRDGNVLELPSGPLAVAEACSGLRSLVSLTAIAILLAWAAPARRRVTSLAIVAAAVPIAIVTNGFRIAAVGLACETWGPRMASGGWHTFSGWLTFAVSALVLISVQRVMVPARCPPIRAEGVAAA
ncbi:MAG TPA: exosortase/archaeosortase family protein [Vicinamibacterales bacterium]|nr:exosortase/archaeosortase family protein [Vicinamibacterales bacterium]